MTSVISKSALVLAACASLNAFAGTAPAPSKGVQPVVEEPSGALFDTVGATLETGYDTRYYFRGLWFADDTLWTGLSLSIPLTEQLSFGAGALYTRTVDSFDYDYSELDLFASLTYDAGFGKFGLVYTHYEFFDGFSGRNAGGAVGAGEYNIGSTEEVGVTFSTALGGLNLYTGVYYDFNIGGTYVEVGADYPIEITSWLSLVPAVKTGYGFDYYSLNPSGPLSSTGAQSGFTHVIPSLSAPIKLTKFATLTPYVAYNISLDARHANNLEDNELFGGVKLSVSF